VPGIDEGRGRMRAKEAARAGDQSPHRARCTAAKRTARAGLVILAQHALRGGNSSWANIRAPFPPGVVPVSTWQLSADVVSDHPLGVLPVNRRSRLPFTSYPWDGTSLRVRAIVSIGFLRCLPGTIADRPGRLIGVPACSRQSERRVGTGIADPPRPERAPRPGGSDAPPSAIAKAEARTGTPPALAGVEGANRAVFGVEAAAVAHRRSPGVIGHEIPQGVAQFAEGFDVTVGPSAHLDRCRDRLRGKLLELCALAVLGPIRVDGDRLDPPEGSRGKRRQLGADSPALILAGTVTSSAPCASRISYRADFGIAPLMSTRQVSLIATER
jgi:hypothetical protein